MKRELAAFLSRETRSIAEIGQVFGELRQKRTAIAGSHTCPGAGVLQGRSS